MTIVKKTAEYSVFKRRDGRYAVKNAKGQPINGDEKVTILTTEGLLTAPVAKVEEPAEEVVEEATEAPAE